MFTEEICSLSILSKPVTLQPHSTREKLEEIFPEGQVSGGSFSENLPNAADIDPTERVEILKKERKLATKKVIIDLFGYRNISINIPIERGPDGMIAWPEGYTGSLTDKGALVLGVVSEKDSVRSVGIDLELNQFNADQLNHTAKEGEIPPTENSDLGLLAAFSVKEAVYKANFQIDKETIDFDDIRIEWNGQEHPYYSGIAECNSDEQFEVRNVIDGDWTISVAIAF